MEIKDFKKIDNGRSPLKASFMVHIPEWDFNIAITYYEKNGGAHWFGYPQQEWTNQQGEKKYKWLAYFGEKGKTRFEKALKEKLSVLLPKNEDNQDQNYNNEDLPF